MNSITEERQKENIDLYFTYDMTYADYIVYGTIIA